MAAKGNCETLGLWTDTSALYLKIKLFQKENMTTRACLRSSKKRHELLSKFVKKFDQLPKGKRMKCHFQKNNHEFSILKTFQNEFGW